MGSVLPHGQPPATQPTPNRRNEMSKKNGTGKSFDLDLSPLIEPIHLKAGDYEATLSGDMSLTGMAKMSRAFSRMGEVIEGKIELEDLGVSETEMWELVEEILAKADPPPSEPAQELLNTQAAIKLLSFLASRTTDAFGEKEEATS